MLRATIDTMLEGGRPAGVPRQNMVFHATIAEGPGASLKVINELRSRSTTARASRPYPRTAIGRSPLSTSGYSRARGAG